MRGMSAKKRGSGQFDVSIAKKQKENIYIVTQKPPKPANSN